MLHLPVPSKAIHRSSCWKQILVDTLIARVRISLAGIAAVPLLWAAALVAAGPQTPDRTAERWDDRRATALLVYAEGIGSHGLDPGGYQTSELRLAIRGDDPAALEQAASRTFGLVARDLAEGHLRPGSRGRYSIPPATLDPLQAADLIDLALREDDIAGTLDRLAPRGAQYAGLRRALARLPAQGEADERQALLVNLERWRWLPRELGARHILVNIPEYRLALVDNGREVSSHRVIVGRPNTPTLQFSAVVNAVTLNPTWTVPQSIIAESIGRLVRNQPAVARARGYVWSWDGGRLRVVQSPGPNNALGQVRFDMPNPHSIFVHDTPSKDLFNRDTRTLSHGCVRTEHPLDLAQILLADAGWDRARIDRVVAERRTTRVPLPAGVPIYIVYLTTVVSADGSVRYLDDPYNLDGGLAQRVMGAAERSVALSTETECAAA